MLNKLHVACLLSLMLLVNPSVFSDCLTNKNPNIEPTKPSRLYIDHGRGVVTDKVTGLMWQKCDVGYTGADCRIDDQHQGPRLMSWLLALDFASNNTNYGYNDWRLPNIKELQSLVESACFNPALNDALFPIKNYGHYWTSTPDTVNDTKVWVMDLGSGQERIMSKESVLSLLLVRSVM